MKSKWKAIFVLRSRPGERIVIRRHGKRIAVLLPVDDLELLEAIEDRVDLALAKKALKEKGRIPWGQAKKELGLA